MIEQVDPKQLNQAHLYVLENTNEGQQYIDIEVSNNLRWISHGPRQEVIKYHGYIVNGVRFHTKMHDDAHCYQNSGVSLVAKTMLVSSAKDKKPIVADICFYGIIEDIWLLDYCSFKIPVFKCQWEKSDGGVRVDELGFTLLLSYYWYRSD
ncbi:hypothetical protein UlMin_006385 [Ulmus minor]